MVASLTRIAKMFEGVHDFSNFSTQKKKKSLSQDIKETTTKEGEDEEDDEGEEDDDEEENEEANDGEEKRSKEQRKAKEVISTNRAGGEGKEIRIINKFECKGEVDVKGIKMYCMEGMVYLWTPLSLWTDMSVLCCVVTGRSFVQGQIRKMVSLLSSVYLGYHPSSIIPVALSNKEQIHIPLAPPDTLMLQSLTFDQHIREYHDSFKRFRHAMSEGQREFKETEIFERIGAAQLNRVFAAWGERIRPLSGNKLHKN